MECVLNSTVSGFDTNIPKNLVISDDLQQLECHRYNDLFEAIYRAALDCLVNLSPKVVNDKIASENPELNMPLDLRLRKGIKVASFANNLASQPNIISSDRKKKIEEHVETRLQKNMKKERLLEARKRLKEARKLWKTRIE